jgi:hypothetical protein
MAESDVKVDLSDRPAENFEINLLEIHTSHGRRPISLCMAPRIAPVSVKPNRMEGLLCWTMRSVQVA